MRKLPSKKIALLIIVIALLLGGFFLFEYKNSPERYVSKSAELYSQAELQKAFAKTLDEKDSDSDGLKDWEESLWGTDKSKSDSDNDGTKDGEEPKEGRNPMVPGPNDKMNLVSTASTTTSIGSGGDLTLTQNLSQEFMQEYLTLKASGVPVTGDLQASLIGGLINKSLGTPSKAKTYVNSDFRLIEQNSATIQAYAKNIVDLFNRYPAPKNDNEFAILTRAMYNEDSAELAKLDSIMSGYAGMVQGLLAIEVPRGALIYHAALTNSVVAMSENISGMRNAIDDPIGALASMQSYSTIAKYLETSYIDLSKYVSAQK